VVGTSPTLATLLGPTIVECIDLSDLLSGSTGRPFIAVFVVTPDVVPRPDSHQVTPKSLLFIHDALVKVVVALVYML
jgi:hypothetical protein